MNKNKKRNLKRVVVGGLMALTLTTCVTTTAKAVTDPPIVFNAQQALK